MDKQSSGMQQVITLSAPSCQENLFLSEVIASYDKQAMITLVIPQDTAIELVDDIAYNNKASVQITLIVEQDASVIYTLRAADKIEQSEIKSVMIDRSLSVVLNGKRAHADVRCVCYGDADDSFTFKMLQEHRAQDTTSSVVVKAVLNGNARLSCKGLIRVEQGGSGTNANLVNKNILLSRSAKAISVPMLEVKTNDVKCKHGAAVSRLSDEHRFYLESKGIDPLHTEKILLKAFLE